MGWITLDNDVHVRAKYRDKSDFQGLVFPKISYKEEIGKSGRVYTYESEHTKENSKAS